MARRRRRTQEEIDRDNLIDKLNDNLYIKARREFWARAETEDERVLTARFRDLHYYWSHLEDFGTVTGPACERTHMEAMRALADAEREMGEERFQIGRYLSVAPNMRVSRMWSVEQKDGRGPMGMVEYRPLFELYMHEPILFGTGSNMWKRAIDSLTRLRARRDRGLVVRDPRNATYGDVLIGEVSFVDVDLLNRTGTVRVGAAETSDMFEVTLSLDQSVLEEDRPSELTERWMAEGHVIDDM